jgi:hypothetical protein
MWLMSFCGPLPGRARSGVAGKSKKSREDLMRVATLLLAGGLTLAASSALADDPMANFYPNTIVSKGNANPNAAPASLFFNKDGTYTGKTTDAKAQPVALSGTWVQKDDGKTICITASLPPNAPANTPAPKPSCGIAASQRRRHVDVYE